MFNYLENVIMCDDGCVEVESYLLQKDKTGHRSKLTPKDIEYLQKFKCFVYIDNSSDYGHINYAVMGYAVKHGHYECLKTLHEIGADWHSDLGDIAFEFDQTKCLNYILENMGRVMFSYDINDSDSDDSDEDDSDDEDSDDDDSENEYDDEDSENEYDDEDSENEDSDEDSDDDSENEYDEYEYDH